MIEAFGSSEVAAAVVGAVAVGLLSVLDRIFDRRRRREAMLVAIASEVQAICNLIRNQGYFDQFRKLADQIRAGTWNGVTYVIDVRGDYFKVFDSLALDLGSLKPKQVSKIVSFYTYCQSAIDSTRPDGPLADDADAEDRASNVIGVEGVFMAILHLGDEIVGFTKRPLPVIEA